MLEPQDLGKLDMALGRLASLLCDSKCGTEDGIEILGESTYWDLENTSGTTTKGLNRQLPVVLHYCLKMREKATQESLELYSARKRIIQLQEELITCKKDQLQSLQSTVKTSVADTVKEEISSYSAAVNKDLLSPTIPADTVKSIVKTVVREEDRSRSVIMFGLQEEKEEEGEDQLTAKVEDVLQEIGMKPRLSASRIGVKSKEDSTRPRPVKITVSNSIAVDQILSKSRHLSQSEKNSGVFLSPDRSPSQRQQHRSLVQTLKEKRLNDPGNRHYILGNKIVTDIKSNKKL